MRETVHKLQENKRKMLVAKTKNTPRSKKKQFQWNSYFNDAFAINSFDVSKTAKIWAQRCQTKFCGTDGDTTESGILETNNLCHHKTQQLAPISQ